MQTLNEKINGYKEFNDLPQVSSIIINNLNPNFELRPYQKEAISRFDFYWNSKHKQNPTHLLFHMATGSGKTIIMASSIIYLYQQGYRNFLFFVNSNNIIQKTKDNFLSTGSSKYLFNQNIEIDGKRIDIQAVDNFQSINEDGINICFTTIQGLHTKLTEPQENSLTFDDFSDKKIVLISDEAHHINSDTKKGLSEEESLKKETWESTIDKIHRSNAENVLLEYTATIDLTNQNIVNKYSDKLLFDYPLRKFRIDGYSKEVRVSQHDTDKITRALIAIILSQYRLKLFQKNGLNIKPVILFKAKDTGKCDDFFGEFIEFIDKLSKAQIDKLKSEIDDELLKKAFNYFNTNNIDLDNLVLELKESFSENKMIKTHSKTKDVTGEKQLILNSLEDAKNEYRAIFAVDQLNEGWDVLNLFDIVRLYDTRDAKGNKAGKTTISEAQLIGRGARYCPFVINQDDLKYQRKYDQELDNELKFCEELVYYSSYNPKYIQELTSELKKQGIIPDTHKKINLNLKESFRESNFFQTAVIWTNERVKYDRKDIVKLNSLVQSKIYRVKLISNVSQTSLIFGNVAVQNNSNARNLPMVELCQIPKHIKLKALNFIDFYQFNNLVSFLPNLKSYSEFLDSADYCKNLKIEINTTKLDFEELDNTELFVIAKSVFGQVAEVLKSDEIEYRGTTEFKGEDLKRRLRSKVLNIAIEQGNQEFGVSQNENQKSEFQLDLRSRDWYVYEDNYGTSEEKYLVKTIDSYISKLQKNYEDVYLIRNEKIYKIYTFDDGRPFEPDYLLYMKEKNGQETIQYQLFIEPKGGHLLENDKWKNDFLLELESKVELETLFKNKHYKILGLPFYNEDAKMKFITALEPYIKD